MMQSIVSSLINVRQPHNQPILIATMFIFVILALGTVYTVSTQATAPLLQIDYLLQQLQSGSFLGIVAIGMMMVILLGHIDLSIPWTMTAAAIIATSIGGVWAIPVGICVGALVGIVNGLGVAFLRVPSMIFTLGMNAVMRGIVVVVTGGFAPQTNATDAMKFIASSQIFGIPVAIFVWILVSIGIATMLVRTGFGRSIYSIGNSEAATYLSGVRTRLVIMMSFALCGAAAGLAGVMLAGYSAQAYQGMGDPFLLPAIAAVVIGGTHILGGSGRLMGTIIGAILIVLLNSVLSIMQMPEAYRQIIYGGVIIGMLLIYGRGQKVTS